MSTLIGTRLKALREERKLSQDDLARMFGFKDRQTVSAIENGERRLSAEELLLAVEKLASSLEYFTDPFMLAGEGSFSWRQSGVSSERLNSFERVVGRWVAAIRTLAPAVGRPGPNMRQSLKLTSKSSFDDAMAAGERFATDFGLGDVPARRLAEVMEGKLGILVLMIDAFEGVSGAACRLPELDAVLINRREIAGRRHFDLAHELFHILTWDTMPPEHVEESSERSRSRVEQLANSFASALLMPAAVLDGLAPAKGYNVKWLNDTAEALQVTASALKWRLVALGRLDSAEANRMADSALRNNGRKVEGRTPPPLFSKAFMEVIALAIDDGQVSARKAADLLDLKLEDLAELCATHGVKASVDL
ncbi:ImmA/IrrE family metallo-endopeptidase [Bradyrhizobium sp. AUGA SZCCT0158]|uniref:XRE family transcriptional regulator n=1 Tax=Bradyrhizobium sp. AUGA SZCCT0158 TaxID=2807661 RepID=UPI001BA6B17D|nr:XRE family transcriptional regulator [Bradyrhizobium sp. AUGA SZCCT0158]MBR1197795.1 ImmA/IrrE family metallo-endopeptidase [Bradyrhizobium sp. AUGA SZCCT0158]